MMKEEALALIHTFGLERVADVLESLMLPAIRLHEPLMSDQQVPLGVSKLGGTPDLPPEIAWPEWKGVPLAFIAQFHLPELAAYDSEQVLPKDGWLYFFYEADEQPWGFEPAHFGAWRVFHYAGELAQLQRAARPHALPKWSRFHARTVTYEPAIALPEYDALAIAALELSQSEVDRYLEVFCKVNALGHQLLGHPMQIQGEMQMTCELGMRAATFEERGTLYDDPATKTQAMQWRLLLQVDSMDNSPQNGDQGTSWGEVGQIYYWIRQEDLKARDFSQVWLQLQCA
ncbi:MAG TPA: YwqG family protein [Ktedonobacterales bacterium]